ncbi:hypothetical protein GWI33_006869 [Rhynchophorus ferrugineus]|uniref:Uncharacterized protein n=1 Tax=Rhynchophorus ferrugineus TaxID=354439 RepID=A0A834IH05_RHYFE|nr:hypothetical protein GWI33_006869 [Rhynchophorus ferrugineus]
MFSTIYKFLAGSGRISVHADFHFVTFFCGPFSRPVSGGDVLEGAVPRGPQADNAAEPVAGRYFRRGKHRSRCRGNGWASHLRTLCPHRARTGMGNGRGERGDAPGVGGRGKGVETVTALLLEKG